MIPNNATRVLLLVLLSIFPACIIFAVPTCDGMKPKAPGPYCMDPFTRCEDVGESACPLVASCLDLIPPVSSGPQGDYPKRVPNECESGGSLGNDLCMDGTQSIICWENYSCQWNPITGECFKVDLCFSRRTGNYKVNAYDCLPPGS